MSLAWGEADLPDWERISGDGHVEEGGEHESHKADVSQLSCEAFKARQDTIGKDLPDDVGHHEA